VVRPAGGRSLYAPELADVPSGSVPGRKPGTAFPWSDGATGSAPPAAAARPLFSSAPLPAPPPPPLPSLPPLPRRGDVGRQDESWRGRPEEPDDFEIIGDDPSF
jgi:hypothetical protein